jgi:hypothetical protein
MQDVSLSFVETKKVEKRHVILMKALAGRLAPRSCASTVLAISASQQNSRDVPNFKFLF